LGPFSKTRARVGDNKGRHSTKGFLSKGKLMNFREGEKRCTRRVEFETGENSKDCLT